MKKKAFLIITNVKTTDYSVIIHNNFHFYYLIFHNLKKIGGNPLGNENPLTMPKSSTQPKSSKAKTKPRIRISAKKKPQVIPKKLIPKKRKRSTKSSALSTKTSKTKSPNGQAFDIEKTLTSLALFAENNPRSDADLVQVAVGCSTNHHKLKYDVLNDCGNCL